ncbi:pilus assembly protein PilP [Methylophilus aquaticus]|uniref:Pilus assembly protein PilP n=1 Tax=Methylophilus aquaticus TaxID=1971610 RepID=A0ABT9JPA5_9PROT|nr:pilus assembly protein PilP [Methylophilus aquaticus]MDP8566422.1 pilus assembly protein PilP [Methylophilus aquaticus]
MIRANSTLWVCVCCLLAACAGPESDDLTAFMQETSSHLPVNIEPLPQVQAFVSKPYNADGALHDPFVPRKAEAQNLNQPDLKRPREPLEAYPLEGLKFVGVVSRQHKTYATIQTPDNMIYQVKQGNYIGEKLGLITALAENKQTLKYEMTVKETVQDATTGEWTDQMTTLELQGNQ